MNTFSGALSHSFIDSIHPKMGSDSLRIFSTSWPVRFSQRFSSQRSNLKQGKSNKSKCLKREYSLLYLLQQCSEGIARNDFFSFFRKVQRFLCVRRRRHKRREEKFCLFGSIFLLDGKVQNAGIFTFRARNLHSSRILDDFQTKASQMNEARMSLD